VPEDWIQATGRRKTSIARVMLKKGSGKIEINGRAPEEYFPTKNVIALMIQPLEVTDSTGKWDVKINVRGGGPTGQSGAILHGLSRAIVKVDPDSRMSLHKSGFPGRSTNTPVFIHKRSIPGDYHCRKLKLFFLILTVCWRIPKIFI
jgi:small subunit ribosomal protein S9